MHCKQTAQTVRILALKWVVWSETCRNYYSGVHPTRHFCTPRAPAISWASLDLQSYKLAWANPCPNPTHTPIFSQIGKEMTEKSLKNWNFSNLFNNFTKSAISLSFLYHWPGKTRSVGLYTQYPIEGMVQNPSGFRLYLVIPYFPKKSYVVTMTSLTK